MRGLWTQLLRYFWPPRLFAGFSYVLSEWHRGDAKNRSLLLAIFAPMLICMVGLVLTLASFIFAFVAKLLGWFLLTVLFGGGGIFCYEKLREKQGASSPHYTNSTAYDATTASENVAGPSAGGRTEESKKNDWFNGVRNMKWPR